MLVHRGFLHLNRNNSFNFLNLLLEQPLNTLLEGYCGARSAAAGSFQANFYQAAGINVYKFNIAAISLKIRTYFLKDLLNTFLHLLNLLPINYIMTGQNNLYVTWSLLITYLFYLL